MASRNRTTPALESDRLYKIGEVSRIVGVESFVLRYWETEFSEIQPVKAKSKHRLYDKGAIETVLKIKRLLHEEKYTIEGARRRLEMEREETARAAEAAKAEAAREKQLALGLQAEKSGDNARLALAEAVLKETCDALGRLRKQLSQSTPSPTPFPEVGE